MLQKQVRWLAGTAGGIWGLFVGITTTVLLLTFLSGGNALTFVLLMVLAPITGICGIVFGVRAALRFLPHLLPLRFSNIALRKAVLIFVGVPVALLAAFLLPFNPFNPPSDQALLADFQKHEATLDHIATMIQHDKGLKRIDDTWTMPRDPKEVGVSNARITEYRKLLQSVSINRGFFVPNAPSTGEIAFYNWITGSAISSDRTKGFAYLDHPPKRLLKSLDNCYGESKVFRHIKGHWYLFYEYIAG